MAAENWTFWLNMTNFALGMITLAGAGCSVWRSGLGFAGPQSSHTRANSAALDLNKLDRRTARDAA